MQNPMKKLTLPNLQVLIAALVWTILLVMPAQLAHAYQVPTTAAGTWTLVGGVAQKTTPSGVRVNITPSSTVTISALNNTSQMAGLTTGATLGTFLTPALPLATNGLQLITASTGANAFAAKCAASNPNDLICNTVGTLNITFTDAAGVPIAVRNPTMHLSRIGGNAGSLFFGVTYNLTSTGER